MDKALEKFGIYDFMGIWGPGAITVTYFYFTMHDVLTCCMGFFHVIPPHISESNKLLILFTAVAYVVGAILHELGKFVVERDMLFEYKNAQKTVRPDDQSHKGLFYYISQENERIMRAAIPDITDDALDFDKAMSNLKYRDTTGTSRIDKYHSIYGLSRSLTICFIIHAFSGIMAIVIWNDIAYIPGIALDCVLALLFWVRTYRYYCSWIRNVLIQYHFFTSDFSNK